MLIVMIYPHPHIHIHIHIHAHTPRGDDCLAINCQRAREEAEAADAAALAAGRVGPGVLSRMAEGNGKSGGGGEGGGDGWWCVGWRMRFLDALSTDDDVKLLVRCSALQCAVCSVQCVVQCSAVSAVQCGAVRCSAVQCSAVHCVSL